MRERARHARPRCEIDGTALALPGRCRKSLAPFLAIEANSYVTGKKT